MAYVLISIHHWETVFSATDGYQVFRSALDIVAAASVRISSLCTYLRVSRSARIIFSSTTGYEP